MTDIQKRVVDVPGLADPTDIGLSFVQCVEAGDWVYLAGQISVDENFNVVAPYDIEAQTRKTFENIETALEAAGSSLENLVHMTAYLTDMEYQEEFLATRRDILGDNLTTSSMIGSPRLAMPGLVVEIEARAIKDDADVEKRVVDVPGLPDLSEEKVQGPGGELIDRSLIQCLEVGDWVYLSGQVAVDENFDVVSMDAEEQVRQTFKDIELGLEAAGSSLNDLIHMTAWLPDIRHQDAYLETRGDVLGNSLDDLTTSTMVACSQLALPEFLIEIEARGIKSNGDLEKVVHDPIPGLPDPTTTEGEGQQASTRSYVQSISVGDWVSLAGLIGTDENYEPVSREFGPQVRKTFENIELALDAAGSSLSDLTQMTVYLDNIQNAEEFLEIRGEVLGDDLSTSTMIEQRLAWPSLEIEIDVEAVKS